VKRRDFIALLGSGAASPLAIGSAAAFAWPSLASAQQSGKLPIIGFLGVNPAMWAPWTGAFVDRLNALGWVDGRTATLEFRWAQGRPELHAQYAQEFVQLKASVIVTSGAAVPALMQATSTIPIVFAVANDPVGAGMVKSLARPGGNVTGISLQTLDLANKRFEFFREAVPDARRLAIMADATFTQAILEMNTVQELARKFGIESIPLEIRRTEDIEPAFARLKSEKADALYVVINELLNANRLLIVRSAEAARLPSIYGTRDWVRSGGLMSYGPNFPSLFARSAEITDKILRGTKPENIPVEQPTRFELAVNLKTSKAIGVQIPETFLARADDVIE
jgi:putative tryptophan/tyrosine transport system substrate-binding protein